MADWDIVKSWNAHERQSLRERRAAPMASEARIRDRYLFEIAKEVYLAISHAGTLSRRVANGHDHLADAMRPAISSALDQGSSTYRPTPPVRGDDAGE